MKISRGTVIAIGFFCVTSGTAGFERYMATGAIGYALFDAILTIVGMVVLATGFDRKAAAA